MIILLFSDVALDKLPITSTPKIGNSLSKEKGNNTLYNISYIIYIS